MNKLVTVIFAACLSTAGTFAFAASHAGAQKDEMKKDGMMKKEETKK